MKKERIGLHIKNYNGLRKTKKAVTSEDVIPDGLPFITEETRNEVSKNFCLGEYTMPEVLWHHQVGYGFRYPYQVLCDVSVAELNVWNEYCSGMVDPLNQWVHTNFNRSHQEYESATIGGTIVFAAYRQQLGFDVLQRYRTTNLKEMMRSYEEYSHLPDETIFSRAKSKLVIPTHQVNLNEIIESVVNLCPAEHAVRMSAAVTYRVMENFWRRSN